jgi:polysaccharide chain length determinant protein (PEP-CTERM system associated)
VVLPVLFSIEILAVPVLVPEQAKDSEEFMLRNGSLTYSEVKRMMRRYWWLVPTTMLTVGALGLLAALVLPKKYTSSTMVLVEPPAVSPEVVPTVGNEDLYRHLSSMKDEILSRTRLQPIVEKFNLYPNLRGSEHMEDLVDRLKKSTEVELIQPMVGSTNRQPPGFHVSVTFSDPQLAMNICQEITSMFMEQNISSREKQVRDTGEFLKQQLAEAKTSLDQQDAKLAQFKRQYLGSLPEEQQSNLSLLGGMNSQLEATTQSLSRAHQDKAFNESLLNQQETVWKSAQAGMQSADSLEQQLATLQEQLSGLLAKYTPEHPDVVKLKAQIEDVKRKIATAPAEPKSSTPAPHETPQMQQLRAKIKQDDLSIADLGKHQAQIQEQIRLLQSHVQASPMVEQQLKELTRNYQTALDNYNDLLKKQQKSSMAIDLEHQQQSETWRVLDPPSLPIAPSFPKKPIFLAGGLGAGLALGFAVLYLLAMADKAMYTERDVELCLKLPVLTIVPSFDSSLKNHPSMLPSGRKMGSELVRP